MSVLLSEFYHILFYQYQCFTALMEFQESLNLDIKFKAQPGLQVHALNKKLLG